MRGLQSRPLVRHSVDSNDAPGPERSPARPVADSQAMPCRSWPACCPQTQAQDRVSIRANRGGADRIAAHSSGKFVCSPLHPLGALSRPAGGSLSKHPQRVDPGPITAPQGSRGPFQCAMAVAARASSHPWRGDVRPAYLDHFRPARRPGRGKCRGRRRPAAGIACIGIRQRFCVSRLQAIYRSKHEGRHTRPGEKCLCDTRLFYSIWMER